MLHVQKTNSLYSYRQKYIKAFSIRQKTGNKCLRKSVQHQQTLFNCKYFPDSVQCWVEESVDTSVGAQMATHVLEDCMTMCSQGVREGCKL